MRALTAATLLSVLVLGGCARSCTPTEGDVADTDPDTDVDGVRCQDAGAATRASVYIDLDYAPGPEIAPCSVDAGTRITWRAPEEARSGFVVDFIGASPAVGAPKEAEYASNSRSGRPKVTLVANNEPGTYEYHYSVDGRVVDPVIIIRRQN